MENKNEKRGMAVCLTVNVTPEWMRRMNAIASAMVDAAMETGASQFLMAGLIDATCRQGVVARRTVLESMMKNVRTFLKMGDEVREQKEDN